MSRRGVVIGAATAALALFALVAMHGLSFTPTAAVAAMPGGVSHHSASSSGMAPAQAHDQAQAPAVAQAHDPATPVVTTSDDAGPTAPHAHSVWHLCLAVLVAFAGLALAASVGRRLTDLLAVVRGRWVRVLESRALDPPTQAGLCLLRC